MGRIKNAKLRQSIFLYLVIFLTVGIVLSIMTKELCYHIKENIWMNNLENLEEYIKWQEEYNEVFQDYLPIPISSMKDLGIIDRVIIEMCDFVETWSIFIFAFGSALVSVIIFYNNRLKKALSLLNSGAKDIGNNNLEFELSYDRSDEMGNLCEAFDKMRLQLLDNNRSMWKMVEEQKQLRAALVHDIRAPLTVLKGYVQFVLRYLPEKKISNEKLLEILKDIEEQAERLEKFSDSIKTIQKFDNVTIKKEIITVDMLTRKVEKTAQILKRQSTINVLYEYKCFDRAEIVLDIDIFMEVIENIFCNAIRYAKSKIKIEIDILDNEYLKLIIVDDGNGFSQEDLNNACKLYYHEEATNECFHYGIGLYICKVLCEKHDGRVVLCNSDEGGAKVIAYFRII